MLPIVDVDNKENPERKLMINKQIAGSIKRKNKEKNDDYYYFQYMKYKHKYLSARINND
jgi:hypothetical protein